MFTIEKIDGEWCPPGCIVMWFCCGLFLTDFLPQGSTINSTQYYSTLVTLQKAIKSKRQDLLTQQIILLHDNVSCETLMTLKNSVGKWWNIHWTVWICHPVTSTSLNLLRENYEDTFSFDDEVKKSALPQ